MIRLEWSDEFDTGIDLIDKQHRILFRAINLLGLALERGSDKELMDAIFETLADYTATHFADEERMFEAAGYPDAEEHRHTHRLFLVKMQDLKARFDAGGDNAREVMLFLVEWLRNHVLGTDRKYIPYVLDAGSEMRTAG